MPADEGLRLDDDEGTAPVEELAEKYQFESLRAGGSARPPIAFDVELELLTQEDILCDHGLVIENTAGQLECEYERKDEQLDHQRSLLAHCSRKMSSVSQGDAIATSVGYEYNDYGQLTRLINPNAHETALTYASSGVMRGYLEQSQVDPSGLSLTTRYETDAKGNVTAEITPRGVRHERVYNALDWSVETRAAATGSSDGAPA